MNDGLTLTIDGGDRWTKPQTTREHRTMTVLMKLAGDPAGCCGTCAFRDGTEANRSQLVLHLIESCILDEGNTFMCHEAERPCVGFMKMTRREGVPALAIRQDGDSNV
jgi:hypothetical protein